jgi:Ala-tRNA(Pro) deacylase
MSVEKLKEYLDSHKIMYTILEHSPAYTAQEIASSAHIRGKELAKTVIVKIDGKVTMTVLPASYRVDLVSLKEALGAKIVELATEEEFSGLFPGCDTGAMPPFGNLYDMEVLVAFSLTEDDNIAFNACSHSELMQLAYKDYEKLVQPTVIKFSVKREN